MEEIINHLRREFPERPLPDIVYRFFDENGLNTLVDGTLKLTPYLDFNDPFETSPALPDFSKISIEEIRGFFMAKDGFARRIFQENNSEGEYKKLVDQFVHSRAKSFPQHFKEIKEAAILHFTESDGLSCFSEFDDKHLKSPEAILHWSHYAKNHTGIAIGFKVEHPILNAAANQGCFDRVEYFHTRPVCSLKDFEDFSTTNIIKVLRRWSRQKSGAWKHEKEWRLVVQLNSKDVLIRSQGERTLFLYKLWDNSQTPEQIKKDAECIQRVIIGAKASNDLRLSVHRALSRPHLRHVKIFEAKLNDYEYTMDIIPINE